MNSISIVGSSNPLPGAGLVARSCDNVGVLRNNSSEQGL